MAIDTKQQPRNRASVWLVDETERREIWERFGQLMDRIADADEPYSLGLDACGCLRDALTRSMIADRIYGLWGELTDRYELRPEDRGTTEALMRRAASEWLAAKDDDSARDRYLDYWMYEVCGDERPC